MSFTFTPVILTTASARAVINDILYLNAKALPDSVITEMQFLGVAESVVKQTITNWQDIMNQSGVTNPTPDDYINLQSATAHKCAMILAPRFKNQIMMQEKWDNYESRRFQDSKDPWGAYCQDLEQNYGEALYNITYYQANFTDISILTSDGPSRGAINTQQNFPSDWTL